MKYFVVLSLIVAFAACKRQPELPQMKTYYSSNKSFSIDIPMAYTPFTPALPDYLTFRSEYGMITIERKFMMSDEDFKKYVNGAKAENSSKYHCSTRATSDTLCHYKFTKGFFVMHQFYMRKVIEGYSYVVSMNDISVADTVAKTIYNSITAY